MRFSWLDVKLGARLIAKFPFISTVGALALAIAIGIGAIWTEMVGERLNPTLPFAGGRRVVRIEGWDAARLTATRPSPQDFLSWRSRLTSVVDLGGCRTYERNLVVADGQRKPVRVAEITASAFSLARVAAEIGRPLLVEDERIGAPDVAVIGHDLWEQRFDRDPGVVGRTVQIGRVTATIVGVMPDGFGFPYNQEVWVPLRLPGSPPPDSASIGVFGRLADGATFESAQAELGAVGFAAPIREEDGRVQPRVTAFVGHAPGEPVAIALLIGYAAVLLILGGAAANVATLVLARTALRESEIAVRSALGATRGRIIGQILAEALVIAGAATVAGLTLAAGVIRAIWWYSAQFASEAPPFWVNDTIEPSTVLVAAVLGFAGAALVALIPAMKVTGRRAQPALQLSGGGHTTIRFGGLWSFVIVAQVTLTILCLPAAIGISSETVRDYRLRASFPSAQYLTFEMQLDRENTADGSIALADEAHDARLTAVYGDLERRLAEEPGVGAITFGTRLPGMSHPTRVVETQRGNEPPAVLRANLDGIVPVASVDERFFETFGIPLVAGRSFQPGDDSPASRVVIVNESFARNLGGGSPLGVRVRYAARGNEPAGPWHEIVGVVRNLDMEPTDRGDADFIYHPASPATARPLTVAVRLHGDPAQFAPRLAAIARQMDPALRLYDLLPMEEVVRRRFLPIIALTMAATLVVGLAVLLSAAGLFALMQVAVARRTREIAIRLSLGATRFNVLAAVFGRAARQLGLGILCGNLLPFVIMLVLGSRLQTDLVVPLLAVSALMVLVGLLACIAPMRRALAIEPTEALKLS